MPREDLELPVTGYIIRYKVQNSNMFKYWAVMSNSETEVTGLNPGTVYRVYVAGVSAIGPGSYCCKRTPVLVTTYNGKLHPEQLLLLMYFCKCAMSLYMTMVK